MFDERHEIPIIVKQGMSTFDAESGNDQVVGLADGYPKRAQLTKIPCRLRSEIAIEKWDDPKLAQASFKADCMKFVTCALKNLEQNDVADQNLARVLARVLDRVQEANLRGVDIA